jgi:hypothetical protein
MKAGKAAAASQGGPNLGKCISADRLRLGGFNPLQYRLGADGDRPTRRRPLGEMVTFSPAMLGPALRILVAEQPLRMLGCSAVTVPAIEINPEIRPSHKGRLLKFKVPFSPRLNAAVRLPDRARLTQLVLVPGLHPGM